MLHPSTTGFLSLEHIPGILVANALDDVFQDAFIVGEPASLDLCAKEIAEDPSEVFVPRVGQEASGVGEHSHEAGK